MNDESTPGPHENPHGGRHPDQPYSEELQYSQISARVPEKVAKGVFSTGAVVLNGAHEFIIDFLLRMTQPHQVAARVILPPPVVPRFIAALRENISNYSKKFGNPQLPQLIQPPVPPSSMAPPQAVPSQPTPVSPAAPQAASAESPTGPLAGDPSGVHEQAAASPSQTGHVAAGQPPAATPHSEGGDQAPPRVTAQELYEQLKLPDDMLSGTYANTVMIGHTATEFSFDFITSFFPRSAVACRVYLAAPNVPRFLDSLVHSFEQFQRRGTNPPPPGPWQNPPVADE